jgi:hypothetical protein
MKFLKSKILFYIIFVLMLYCLYGWSKKDGTKVTLEESKIQIDNEFKENKDDPDYIEYLKVYNDYMKELDKNKKYDLIVGVISGAFIVYYLKNNLKS